MIDFEALKKYTVEHHEDVVALIKEICKIPAPSGKEQARAEFCREWLVGIGADGVYIDDAYNCVCPMNTEGKDKLTVIVAHTDTVFPDETPMPYSDDGEYLRSPGVGDNTASLAVMLFTVKYFLENDIVPERGVLFVANSGEEGLGNLKGTRKIFEDYEGRIAEFISFDSFKIGRIADECVGSHRYNVKVKTDGGHSYAAFGNRSAVDVLAEMIGEIYAITPPMLDGAKTTYNVGTISGGTSVNTIPESAEMLCEYRSASAAAMREMKGYFKAIFEKERREADVSVTVVGERPCAEGVDSVAQEKLSDKCEKQVKLVTGAPSVRISSSTDCNIPLSLGIVALCIGVYNGGGAHTRAEWVERKSLIPGLELGIRVALEVCNII